MWSWVAHRITGVTLFFFLFVHVVDIAMVNVTPEFFNEVMDTYKNPVVGLMEAGLVAVFLFHALNGLRIIAVDFWVNGPRYQRQMTWAVLVVWAVLLVPFLVRHFGVVFGGAH
jgi:succinate dehydrogenase / fumarate reductase, cytochrome b subunit